MLEACSPLRLEASKERNSVLTKILDVDKKDDIKESWIEITGLKQALANAYH